MDKKDIISRSFDLVINLMNFLGFYPSDKPSILYIIRTYVMFIFLMVIIVPLAIINLMNQKEIDFIEFNFMCISVTEVAFSALRLLPFLINGEKLKKCINYFGQPRFAPKNKEEKRIIDECVRFCKITCKFYFYGVVMSFLLWVLPKLFANNGDLPMDIWLPYDQNSSPQVFYATFFFVTIANAYDCFSGPMIDPMIGTLPYHATTQLKILKYNLKNFHKFVENRTDFSQKENEIISFEEAYKLLQNCIRHHNDILYFVLEFENCFSWCVFYQIAASIICICFSCIGFTLVPLTSINAFKFILYYNMYVFQILFYCFFGTLLYQENNEFMKAICEGPWYRYDNRIRKILLIMMERSKKPMIISAGKIMDLTFQTFISILKASYSLFTVMKKFQ